MNKPEAHPHKPGSRKARKIASAKRQADDAVKIQAQVIALRASMALTWIVVVRFARGAHDVRLHNTGEPLPQGYTEARASINQRWNLPAMRYNVAETVAERLNATLNANRDRSRVAGRA